MFRHATLNRAYRLIWSETRSTWVAVAEFARARGKRASAGLAIVSALAFGATPAVAQTPPPTALPTGGNVVAGHVAIGTQGARMDVTQSSGSAIVNWNSFDIGSQAQVNFAQPDASSVILNRVLGGNGSTILGQMTANGRVFLVDPAGVLFAPGARVDVGGLVASSLGLSDANFLAGKYQFEALGASGQVINEGTLTSAAGGYVALIGPQVSNAGTILAPKGSIGLAAGNRVRLDFDHDGLLSFDVDLAAAAARADNRGLIAADGGRVVMNAQAKDALLSTVLNNEGVIRARSLESRNGEIWLGGGDSGVVSITGTLDASGTAAGQAGGTVKVLGDKVGLFGSARVDASGLTTGGTILVGGNWQGSGAEQRATMTFVDNDSRLYADAVKSGDGGRVVVWADKVTRFYGAISAQGGAEKGDGGKVEVSGKGSLSFNGQVTTRASHGKQGMLLLDPTDLTISDTASGAGSLDTQFNTTTPGIVAFGDGGAIETVSAGALEALAAGTDIDLQATNSITISSLTSAGKGGVEGELTLDQTGSVKFRTGAGGFSMASGNTLNVTGGATLLIDALSASSGGTGDGAVSVGTIQSVGAVTLRGTTVTANGNITTTDTNLTIGGNLVIAEAATPTLSTGAGTAGNVLVSGTTNGTAGGVAETLTVQAGTGTVTFTGNVGTVTGLGSLSTTGGSTGFGVIGGAAAGVSGNMRVVSSGPVSFSTSNIAGYLDVSAGGAVSQSGPLTLGGDLWVKTTSGDITLNTFNNSLGGFVSLIAPLSNGTAGAGNSVLLKANSIKVGKTRPSDSSTTETGITGARVTLEAPGGGSTILADGTQGLVTADEPNGTTPALTIIAEGVIGNPGTSTPKTVGFWVQMKGLVKVVTDGLSAGTVMLFGDEGFQPKYEFSGDPTKRSVRYNGVEATNAQLTGALDAAYLDIRNQTAEIRESGFAKENASKVLRRGVVTSAGPGQPAVDDSTGTAGMEECEGGYAEGALSCE